MSELTQGFKVGRWAMRAAEEASSQKAAVSKGELSGWRAVVVSGYCLSSCSGAWRVGKWGWVVL